MSLTQVFAVRCRRRANATANAWAEFKNKSSWGNNPLERCTFARLVAARRGQQEDLPGATVQKDVAGSFKRRKGTDGPS